MASSPSRETALRVFAREFNDATYTFTESDDERAPNYVLLPTGAKANRVFVVGTVTEVEDVGESGEEYWRARIVDPNGETFYAYAGQYQPDAASVFKALEPPEYVSVVGKPRTYETDEGNINVSLRPESATIVGKETRDRWVAETAQRTLDRIKAFDGHGPYVEMAKDEYGDSVEEYRQSVISALAEQSDEE
jgi:RPA family protein